MHDIPVFGIQITTTETFVEPTPPRPPVVEMPPDWKPAMMKNYRLSIILVGFLLCLLVGQTLATQQQQAAAEALAHQAQAQHQAAHQAQQAAHQAQQAHQQQHQVQHQAAQQQQAQAHQVQARPVASQTHKQ